MKRRSRKLLVGIPQPPDGPTDKEVIKALSKREGKKVHPWRVWSEEGGEMSNPTTKPTKRVRSAELVLCPVCDVEFNAQSRGALVRIGAGDWKGMDVIRCPKCLRRERVEGVER